MSLLTDDEIIQVWDECPDTEYTRGAINFGKAIEATLIKKLAAGVDVERYEYQSRDGTWLPFLSDQHLANTKEDGTWPIRPIYTAEAIAAARVIAIEEAAKLCTDALEEHKLHSNFICAGAIRALIGATNEH